ncbi:arid/bright domain-containing protein [Coccidioides immitis RS]|uniref:Arid/bright domain-containing protein n=1 Tax=Coccidioides immitis (strain RS) TaxID=246410 RepID=J3KBX8_COCIM|nr:arid/bright domain-containing protein [Coccidioides immitis RS]EAS32666.3 arid/bright domain-containing protein [Coccidioides immitis RS]TPX19697.1 hypothetical protein DIZ76_017489 [Coccidioides immitis]
MNAWLNDPATASIQNDNGSFSNATIDPSMAFLQSPNTSDPSQFQRMFNGATRNMSPGFHNPNPVIPSKRARPDDGFSMSPRQAPGALPGSRSQTPHQTPFPGYPDPVNGTPQFAQQPAPTPYQHFQPGSNNPSPSPILQDFDPQISQRVQTASPSPFSPAGVHVASQISPTHSDHGSRVNTPQTNTFGQTQPYVQPSGPQYSPTAPISSSGAHPAMQAQYAQNNPAMMQNYSAQQIASQQRMYQMQIQNQALQFQSPNAPAAGRPMVGGVNAINNPQAAAMRHLHQSMAKPSNPESFLRGLQRFMMARGQQLDLNPIVSGRPIHLMQLYAAVMRLGGSKKLTAMNGWPTLAQQLQFPAMQYPTAAQEIRDVYLRNLAAYEQVWLSSQQKHVDPAQMGIQRPGDPSTIPQPMAPNKTMPQSFDLPPQLQAVTQPSLPQPNNVHSMPVNGFSMASQGKPIPKQQRPLGHQHRSSLSRPPEAASPNGQMAQFPPDVSVSGEKQSSPISARKPGVDFVSYRQPLEDPFKPTILPESAFHGPIVIDEAFQIGEEVMRLKPTVPTFGELGVIDIHALTMSIKSGIHAEMRVALDTLAQISSEPAVQLSLDNCEDLVETLVDCAEDQLDLLADNAAEVSDVMLLPSYEEIVRGCRQEMEMLLDVPEFGSLDYELDRAVDRLICITTLLRNFSFAESNFSLLSMPHVVKFMATVVRYLGTRNMLLRTHQNTLDFMKDAVIYLSNIAHTIHLPGKEEALSLLHFLLSFAPTPPSMGPDGIMFAPYDPSIHRYLPAAVDTLAKLLARDDPNRMYLKSIFSQENPLSPPNDLLTRSFAMSIAPIPEQTKGNVIALADVRKPFLMQGLLSAEILAGIADNELACAWFRSADGFAANLLRLACVLSADRNPPGPQRHGAAARAAEADLYWHSTISNRALTVLSQLAEKSNKSNGASKLPLGIFPKKENLLGALLTPNVDPNVIRQMCEYAGLGG